MTDLFTPGKIGRLEVKNRILRSATWEGMADKEGNVTDGLIEKIAALARGEVGLIILGHTAVAPEGKGMRGMTGIYTDAQAKGHARLVEAVHEAGGAVSVQLQHVGAQTSSKAIGGLQPVGASAVEHPLNKTIPRELSTDEVKGLIDTFGQCAGRAARAGYDAIQVHCAHGYLANQFMSPRFNRRKDEYAAPERFIVEVIEAVKANACGAPVHVKLNVEEFVEGSVTEEVSLPAARKLSEAGVDMIEVSSGSPAAGKLMPSRLKINQTEDEAYFLDYARKVKAEVSCLVAGVGGYRSVEVIDSALSDGVDFVSISRPLIREPDLVKRWKEGDRSRAKCISCNQCFKCVLGGLGLECYVDLSEEDKARLGP